jgi:hypothetical protein
MSSSDAQRSPVHQATEDSNLEPTSQTALPGNASRQPADVKGRPDDAASGRRDIEADAEGDTAPEPVIGGGPGAGDGSSGGGAGAGIPGGGTDMRTNGAFNTGNIEEDRKRLFPEASENQEDQSDPDESSLGGPLRINDPDV